MKLYPQVIKNTISEYTAYRLNFTLWRVRYIIRILVLYFLWQAIFASSGEILGYKQAQIMTYLLATEVVGSMIFSTKTQDIGNEIQQGNLTNFLLKPMNYFTYCINRDIADKLLNIVYAIVEVGLILFFLHPPVVIQSNGTYLLAFFFAVGMALTLYFAISLMLSFFSFWTQESWAPHFLFIVINEFLAGGLFPLDMLPKSLFTAISYLPFPYLLFFPLKVYLGQLSPTEVIKGFCIGLFWILTLTILTQKVWREGLRLYTAEGR